LINSIKQINMFKKFLLVVLIATFGVVFVYACGSESDEQLSGNLLQISISCPDLREADELSRTFGIGDIVILQLTVEGGSPPMVTITKEFDPQESEISIDVPIGTNRMFTIIGFDIEGNIIFMCETITVITIDTTVVDIPCDFVDEICNDGIDNNFDELPDCNDPECDGASCDSENGICMDGTCQDPDDPTDPGDDDDDGPDKEDDFAGECDDEIDNDNDGFADCDDNDCIRSLACLPVFPLPPPPSGVCPMPEGPDCDNINCCQEVQCFCSPICGNSNECRIPAFCSNPE